MPILVSVGFCLEDKKMSGQFKKILKLRGEDGIPKLYIL